MIKITVYQLSPSATARLGRADYVLDIDPETIRFSKDVQKLSLINEIMIEGALGAEVDDTDVNNAIFSEYHTPITVDNRREYYPIELRADGHATNFTRLYYKGFRNRKHIIEFRVSPDYWTELATQVKISDLEYGQVVMDKAGIIALWDLPAYEGNYLTPLVDQNPFTMSPIDFGDFVDRTEPPQNAPGTGRYKALGVEDFRPLISFPYVIRAGFAKFGWTIQGVIFETDWLKRIWLYAIRQDYYTSSNVGGRMSGQRYTRLKVNNQAGGNFVLSDIYDYSVEWSIPSRYPGINNPTGITMDFRYQMQGEWKNEAGSNVTAVFAVFEMDNDPIAPAFTGEVLGEFPLVVEFAPGEKKMVIFDAVIRLKPGQRGAIRANFIPITPTALYVEAGTYVKVTPENKSLMTDDVVKVRDLLRTDVDILTLTKTLIRLINGRVDTDLETKTVTVFPNRKADVWGETAPGFILEEEMSEDISHLIVEGSVQAVPARLDLKRYNRLEFTPTTDAYIQSLDLPEPAHSRTVLNGLQYPNSIESEEVPLIEPTLERQSNTLASGSIVVESGSDEVPIGLSHPAPFLPVMTDNVDGERSFDIAPRLLYHHGKVRQVNPSPINDADKYASFFFDKKPNISNDGLVFDFGYATQLATWPLEPEVDNYPNIVYGVEQTDLFTIFYLGLTQDLRGGWNYDLLMYLKMKDYIRENFRRLKTFRYKGIPVNVPAIGVRDFVPTSDLATPVTFFQSPVETNPCDLPCGCQFTKCDYYQDLSSRMRQETLDGLTLTSFFVNGIELITNPLTLGPIKLVDVGGMPYVMNFVDVLNSVAAPYFSFSLSTRVHPSKGKRFFSVKRPACYPFRIEFSFDDEVVYRYTQEIQETAWFTPGTFNDFGYAPQFFGEPIGCKTTTEY